MLLIQITDLHVRPHGMASSRTGETNMLVERALRAVRAFTPRPDAMIVTGDLTDNGLADEYAELAAILRRTVDLPTYMIPGNHDRREVLKREMRDWPGMAADPEFVHYTVDDLPVRVVMLDTVVPGSGAGELCEKRMRWLDATLAAEPHKPTLVAMHHPPFLTGITHMDRIPLRNWQEFGDLLARHRQVIRVVCGHDHRPITAQVGHTIGCIAPSVAHQVELDLGPHQAPLWNLEPPAFLLHYWNETTGLVTHMGYVENHPGPYPFLLDPDYPGVPPR